MFLTLLHTYVYKVNGFEDIYKTMAKEKGIKTP